MTTKLQACVFPGQGSQAVGMLADFADVSRIVADTFREASDAIGYDLWDLVQTGPAEQLNLTEITQPALLTASVALWRLWRDRANVAPIALSGHSLGEWSALVCSGVLELKDGARLVQLRGRYMQAAVPVGEGAMAAIIGLDDDAINEACREIDEYVVSVNFNAPGQVVIAGSAGAVASAIEACKKKGAKRAVPLSVSAPFHTKLMQPAADLLAVDIQKVDFKSPEISIIHNVTADREMNPDVIKALMIEQIYSPVRWVECARKLVSLGAEEIVECGPGKVLSGLMRRIDRSIPARPLESWPSFKAALEAVKE